EEPALERTEDLCSLEGANARRPAVALGDAGVVLERLVRRVERALQLAPLEDLVDRARLVARPVLRVDGPAHRPETALLTLDPDHDALTRAGVVESLEDPLDEAACLLLSGQQQKDTIASVGGLARFFRGLFSFLGARSTQEERVAAYVIREHDRGRSLHDILDEHYVRNRCSPNQI